MSGIISCGRTAGTFSLLRRPWQASPSDRGPVRDELRKVVRVAVLGLCPLLAADRGVLSRALLLFSTMVSGFDNVHIRANVPRLEEAIKYGQSAGDRWGCFPVDSV